MGKPKHSNDTRGEQKGAQQHAEGQQGPKAREAFLDGISDHSRRDDRTERANEDPRAGGNASGNAGGNAGSDADDHERRIANPDLNRDGGHRLFENRTQHDEAEKNSEKNRMMIDAERHGHDREDFQIPGGRESHPRGGDQGGHRTMKAGGQGGGNRSDEDRGRK